jgi:hypothetical protein
MTLHKTTREFRLDGPILTAKCEDNNKEWKDSTINLDDIYGNIDGEFVAGYPHFSEHANSPSTKTTLGCGSVPNCVIMRIITGRRRSV